MLKAQQARRDPDAGRRRARASPHAPAIPIIVVPFALVPNEPTPAFPAGFNAKPAPFGVGFTGASCSEPRLFELAYAFEQATKRRVPPPGAALIANFATDRWGDGAQGTQSQSK